VKTLSELVDAIRSSAGSYVPQNYDINDIYRALALSFVENAQAVIESGKKSLKKS
jgi:ActR/RegA family two-component response regulator